MAWTAEDRRCYAPAMQEMVRQGMLVRLAVTIDAIDPPAPVGRPRVWPTLIMLQALWHVARDDRAWRRPPGSPPHQTVWSRLMGWRRRAVLDRVLRVLVTCRRLAAGRTRQPTAAIIDTQSVKTGPQRGPRGYDAHKKVPTGPPAGPVPRRGPDRRLCRRWQKAGDDDRHARRPAWPAGGAGRCPGSRRLAHPGARSCRSHLDPPGLARPWLCRRQSVCFPPASWHRS
jgi:transposase